MIGLPNPWVLLGGLVLVGVLTGGAYLRGTHNGAIADAAAWQAREAKIATESAAILAAAQARVTAAEQAGAMALANVSAAYQKKLQEKDHEKTVALATAHAGGLWIDTISPPGCDDTLPQAGPGPRRCTGVTRSEISTAAVDRLISAASEGDAIADQLAACQAVVLKDREVCGVQ